MLCYCSSDLNIRNLVITYIPNADAGVTLLIYISVEHHTPFLAILIYIAVIVFPQKNHLLLFERIDTHLFDKSSALRRVQFQNSTYSD